LNLLSTGASLIPLSTGASLILLPTCASLILLSPGDILKFRAIERAEYDDLRAQVDAGTFQFKKRPVQFSLAEFQADPATSNARLLEALHGD
ncbi:MAG: hypothetical protein HQ511_02830, partial [Rhodospirillales bacterium]|nr:hypothetical protein [Rhodospirillales bacterium]